MGKWLRGCKFVAAYHETPPNVERLSYTGFDAAGLISRLTKREFVGTFCERCGRKGEEPSA
jgi:hypothetical protein